MEFLAGERYVAKAQTPTTVMNGQTVVLSQADGGLYGLDPVGAQIWEWLRTPRSLEELVGLLTAEYEVDAETARGDLQALLADLRGRNLI